MFLPLAHVLARAVQVVCLSAGATLGHTSGAAQLLDDLDTFKPTFLLVVPRIFEKVHAGAEQKATAAGKARLFSCRRRRWRSLLQGRSTPPPAGSGHRPGHRAAGASTHSSTAWCIPGCARRSAAA